VKRQILILEQQSWYGGAQRILEVVLSSIEQDFEPVVAFPERGPFSTALQERHIETLTLPLGKYPPGRKSYRDMMAFALRTLFCTVKIASIIHRKRISLVYINGPRCLPAGVTAAWLMRRPSLFHSHLILTRKPEIALAKHCARHVTKIVACSDAAAESLLSADRRLVAKLDVFHNPTLERVRRVCLPVEHAGRTDHITIGMVGRITEAKGHRVLFNALGKLSAEVRNKIRLIIVGAPAEDCAEDLRYARGLEQYAKEIGLENILWTGYREDVARYYASMDVLVQPSVAESGEALPLAVLEALETGVPIIASRTGGIPEIVRNEFNGLLYPTGDEKELARSVERFVEDSSLRDRLRAGALAPLDDRFSLATFTRNISRAVSLLCHDSNKPAAPACEGPVQWK
jgi:glycosyltransferase involved in cell wall biosynthesis